LDGGPTIRCPECGHAHEWPPPNPLPPRPAWWRITLAQCGLLAVFLALVAGLAAWDAAHRHVLPWWAFFVIAYAMLAVLVPIDVAMDVAARHELEPDRRRAARRLALAGLGINALLTFLGLAALRAVG
jgi:hypothetical protein